MAKGYKIRLGDGSEIGPMDLQAVKDWYAQGLIDKDSKVLRPGSSQWTRLAEVLDLKGSGRLAPERQAPGRSAPPPVKATKRPGRPTPAPVETAPTSHEPPPPWRTVTAGVLLFAGAAAATFWALVPERWLPALDGTPWKEIALVQAALGLCLIRGWEVGRRIVRLSLLAVGIGLFPLAGILIAQGVRGRALLVLASALVLSAGLIAFLSGSALSAFRAALGLILALGGWAGVAYFGLVPESSRAKDVRAWVSPERRFADPALGLSLDPPPAWQVLKKEQTLLPAPAAARIVLAQPRLGGFAFLTTEASPPKVLSLDDYAKRVREARGAGLAAYAETSRSDVAVGPLSGRRVIASWEADGIRYRDQTVVGRDGWSYFALVAFVPEDGSARPGQELDVLAAGLSVAGTMSSHLADAVEAAARAAPHLSFQAAEMVMSKSSAGVLEPEDTFRRAYETASRGLRALSVEESRELGEILTAASLPLDRKDRGRLTTYFERVRDGKLMGPEQDREMCKLMKSGVVRLPPARLARLQVLYEKAIRAAVSS